MNNGSTDRPPPPPHPGLLRRVRLRAMQAGIPLSATLELTERCNVRCSHCYIVNNPARRELDLADWERVLDQLAALGTLVLTFSGGEPMLRDDFFDILALARAREFTFILFTNGTLLTAVAADRLRSLQPQRVELSILGGTAETHDRITGTPGSFERTLRGARLLRDRGVQVQLKATWLRANIEEADQMRALAADLGASFRTGYLLLDHRQKGRCGDSLYPTSVQLETLVKHALGPDRRHEPPQLNAAQKQSLSPCGAGQTSCCIDPYGDVTPCVALRIPLGNVAETPLKKIWGESRELQRLRGIRVKDLPECANCRLYLTCKRCSGVALAETGSMLAASPQACRIARIFYPLHDRETCPLS